MRKYNPTNSKISVDEKGRVSFEFNNLSEKAYDKNDVKNVQKLEKKLQAVLKDVDKTMRGSGLSAPAFSMVRGGITKGLDQIQKFYKIAGSQGESVEEAKEYIEDKLKGYSSTYQGKSKYDGKEFDRKKELATLKKMNKALEVADKAHADLQYPHVVDTVTRIWEHIREAHLGIMNYEGNIKKGEYDGKIDMDD